MDAASRLVVDALAEALGPERLAGIWLGSSEPLGLVRRRPARSPRAAPR